MVYEVGLIAHACGVKQPRALGREHARIVTETRLSIPWYELHPDKGQQSIENSNSYRM